MAQKDAWRAYAELALGMTETSRKKAQKIAQGVAGKGGATAEQLQTLAEDFIKAGLANREAMTRIVRVEIDRALGRVGLATMEEVDELTRRVQELERELRTASGAPTSAPTSVPTVTKNAVAKTAPAKPTIAKKSPVKTAPAKTTPVRTAPTDAVVGRASARTIGPARKLGATKTPAHRASASDAAPTGPAASS